MPAQHLLILLVKLAVAAKKGDDAVTLAETVQGWRAGDRVIITDTQAQATDATDNVERRPHVVAVP